MPILRKVGKFAGGLVFTIFLVASVTVGSLVQLLEYDNLKPLVTPFLSEQFPKQETETLKAECARQDSVQLSLGKNVFSVDCKQIATAGSENITAVIVGKAFDEVYFKKYTCNFVECLQRPGEERFSALLSANAYKFFGNIQFALWAGAIVGAVMMLVSIQTWEGRLKGFGTSLVFTGLPFVLLNQFRNFVLSFLPISAVDLAAFMDKIFSSMSTSYLIILISGVALTAAGYAVNIFRKRVSE